MVAIVPARYHSTRLPAKALADIAGRPMVEHVVRRAALAQTVSRVIVATDDERIARAVEGFGGVAWMTRSDHPSATDRLAEVAARLSCDLVVNVQGDEPLIAPEVIDAVVAPLLADRAIDMTTACRRLQSPDEFQSPHVVKVVCDELGRAMYFSRSPIPCPAGGSGVPDVARAHLGLYAYRRDVLLRLAALRPAPLERVESLEQLRFLAHGVAIHVIETSHHSIGVDTPEDLELVRQHVMAESRT